MTTTALQLINAEIRAAEPAVDAKEAIAALVASSTKIQDNGRIEVLDQDGHVRIRPDGSDMTVSDLVAEIKRSKPALFQAGKPHRNAYVDSSPDHAAGMNLTERMKASLAARNSVEVQNARAAEIAAQGNPWSASSRSITNQMLITNLNPELAAQLKNEAGAKS